MNVSRYNYFVKRDDFYVGYNAASGVFARLSNEDAIALQQGMCPEEATSVDALLEMGFLCQEDELNKLESRFLYQSDGVLELVIVPTLACDLNCQYCFQHNYRGDSKMTPRVQEETLKFVGTLCGQQPWKGVTVTWYGGEPLLALDVIQSMAIGIDEVCSAHNLRVLKSRIITNGTHLSLLATAILSTSGVKEAQISFDGFRVGDGSERPICNADGAPSTILTNALAAQENLEIIVRLNVNKIFANRIKEAITLIRSFGFNGQIYTSRVEAHDEEAGYRASPSERKPFPKKISDEKEWWQTDALMKRKQFAQLEVKELCSNPENLRVIQSRLTPRPRACTATNKSLFVFGPDGGVSRCWLSCGVRSESLGAASSLCANPSPILNSIWDNTSPFQFEECKTCKVLPLCMGGCPHSRVMLKSKSPPCQPIKFQIEELVEFVGKRLAIE